MNKTFFKKCKAVTKMILLLCLMVVMRKQGFSQYTGLGSWNILNVKYNIDARWSVFGEAQLRSLKFYNDFHYHEYKGGVNYKINRNFKLA